jgi:hypothetical protein
MPTIPLNGAHLRVRLIEIEVAKLRLDPENPRLHSAYLTHALTAQPTEKQIAQVLEQLPEFQALLDAITRNHGCFQPPLVTIDCRVLEGNRRVTALRKLRAEHPKSRQWESVTVEQLVNRIPVSQEKALRAKFHLEGLLPWDGLSQLTEYLGVAEREGPDFLAMMLGRFRPQIEPLLVAGRCVRLFSQNYPALRSSELLWILTGLCGVKQIEPQVAFSPSLRCLWTEKDEERPKQQPFPLEQVMRWLAEGRFTKPYQNDQRQYALKPAQVPTLFRAVRQAGEEALTYFLEPDGSLAKAVAFLQDGYSTYHRQQRQALQQTQKFLDLLNRLKGIRRDENPDLHRQALACYHRLGQLLNVKQKEVANVHQSRH